MDASGPRFEHTKMRLGVRDWPGYLGRVDVHFENDRNGDSVIVLSDWQ